MTGNVVAGRAVQVAPPSEVAYTVMASLAGVVHT